MNSSSAKLAKDLFLASSLYDAIEDHDIRAVSYALTEKHADPNVILPNGIAPLHLAVGNDDPAFAIQITKLIIQFGGNPNIKSEDGLTPLHIAAAWGRFELLRLLICCGADPEIRDYCHAMPIDYAAENNQLDIAKYLHYIVYCGPSFAELQDRPAYKYSLDKIIVNNGIGEAQYEVDKSLKQLDDLKKLPRESSTELVENWCFKHAKSDQFTKRSVENLSQKDSFCSSLKFSPDTQFINCNPRVHKKSVTEKLSFNFEFSSTFQSERSLSNSRVGMDIPTISKHVRHADASQESGIAILPDSVSDIAVGVESGYIDNLSIIKRPHDASSDYFTCNEISGSTNILERNVLDEGFGLDESNLTTSVSSNNITEDVSEPSNVVKIVEDRDLSNYNDGSSKNTDISIVEVYKYTDEQEGIILFENRILVNTKSSDVDDTFQTQSSKLTSLPESFEYDTDTLRQELNQCGFVPGPITKTTKRLYLRKLLRIQKNTIGYVKQQKVPTIKVYSKELEKTLNNPTWLTDLTFYRNLEDIVSKEFSNPDVTRRWREGINKSSFTYLLLDPRVTNNLPCRRDSLTAGETWQTFISAIFYVGKGKRSRPYAHLYEAATHWNKNATTSINKKLEHILNIWKNDTGVICLHIFQNVIPCEAYTREAAMIKALKLKNIDNKKLGDFYGTASTWTSKQQKMLGVLLLHKAMLIFLNEGERQLKPTDIN